MKQLRMYASILFMTVAVSCTNDGTSTGNPLVSLTINGSSQSATPMVVRNLLEIFELILPTAHAAPATIEDSTGLPVVLDHFWTTVGEIEFKPSETPDAGEVDGDSVEFEGPYTNDILETNVDPIGTARLSFSKIRRIKVKLIRTATLPAAAPAGLLTKSVYISGQVNGVVITYSSQDETVIEIAGPNPVEVADNSQLLLQIQVANLFKRINLSSIAAPTDIDEGNRVAAVNPCPDIDASANDLYTCFRKGLETEANFGRDNGDDELDGSDDTVR